MFTAHTLHPRSMQCQHWDRRASEAAHAGPCANQTGGDTARRLCGLRARRPAPPLQGRPAPLNLRQVRATAALLRRRTEGSHTPSWTITQLARSKSAIRGTKPACGDHCRYEPVDQGSFRDTIRRPCQGLVRAAWRNRRLKGSAEEHHSASAHKIERVRATVFRVYSHGQHIGRGGSPQRADCLHRPGRIRPAAR